MKAAVLFEQKAPLVALDVQEPMLLSGQVKVRVYASGICGTQIAEIDGLKGQDPYLPHMLGHEGGGVVVDVGPGVTRVKAGDHVVLHWRKAAGLDGKGSTYLSERGMIGAGPVTTFQEIAIVSENRVTPIDHDIPFDIAALMGCAVTTGFGAVFNNANIREGETVAVIGCGGVGLCAVMAAKVARAGRIVAVDLDPDKVEMARALGATDERIGQGQVDVAIDTTGNVASIEMALEWVKPAGGRLVIVGVPKVGDHLTIQNPARQFGKTIVFSSGGDTRPEYDIPNILALYRSGSVPLDRLITHRFPLEQVNEALDVVRSGKAGRVILEM